jgi:preprotein translocase subunit SecE
VSDHQEDRAESGNILIIVLVVLAIIALTIWIIQQLVG